MKVGIIGGGFAGLACAHYVLKAGHQPVVLEATHQLGGTAAPFQHGGTPLDRFPQLIHDTDSALVGLMAEHDALGRLIWREASTAFLSDGQPYPLNSAADLLRFGALTPLERIRAGFATVRATRMQRFGLHLDKVPVGEWLHDLFGTRVYERIWEPYLRARFGDRGTEVPAYWLWERLSRSGIGRRQMKGCLRGGNGWLADQLRDSIVKRGGEVRLHARALGIECHSEGVSVDLETGAESFGALISTVRIPTLTKLARGTLANEVPDPHLEYRSMVNAVVVSRAPLTRFHWTAVGDEEFPFESIVETTEVIPSEWTHSRHVIYLMKSCDARSEAFRESDDSVREHARSALSRFPDFDLRDVEAIHVFRSADTQPVWPIGYLEHRPPPRIGKTRVYMCNDEQAYPRITAWSTSVTLARETVSKLRGDLGSKSCRSE
jgi:protoporphyrinogen oxidase